MKRVLIVDDREELGTALGTLFEIYGFEAANAISGEEALTLMEGWLPDVVISDYMMPNMNGVQLLGLIRTVYQDEKIAFILLSAVCDRHQLENTQADAVFTKPSDFESLLDAVRKATEPVV